jgi:hypothetical protein
MCAPVDILIVLPSALAIADVSVVHPPSVNTLSAAAATVGAPAAHHDALKQASYCSGVSAGPVLRGALWPPRSACNEDVA